MAFVNSLRLFLSPTVMTPRRLALLACAAMIASAIFFLPNVESRTNFTPAVMVAFGLMIVGGLLLCAALRRAELYGDSAESVGASHDSPRKMTRRRWILFGAGVILLLLVGEVSANVLNMAWLHHASHHIQFLTLCAGITLVTVGLAGEKNHTQAVRLYTITRREIMILLAIILFGAGLRFWQLDNPRVMVDEMHNVNGAMQFWDVPDVPLMYPMTNVSPYTWLYPYTQSIVIEVMGRNLAGLRGLSAIVGTLTIAAVWWLARHLFDRKTALLAALILATFPPHIHFSRLAMCNIADPLFGTLALGFLVRGFRRDDRLDYALAGAALGLSQYFYEAGRLLFPTVTAAWVIWSYGCWRFRPNSSRPRGAQSLLPSTNLWPDSPRSHFGWRRIAVTAAVFVCVAMPVYITIYANDLTATGRRDQAGLSGTYWQSLLTTGTAAEWRAFLNHAADPFLFYINKAETLITYGGTQPLILSTLVPLFLLGLWHLIWYCFRRDARGGLLLGWILISSFGSAMLVESFVALRFLGVLPALALVIAVGLRETLPLLLKPIIGRTPIPNPFLGNRVREQYLRISPSTSELFKPAALIAALGIVIALGQATYYFGQHLPYFNQQFRESRNYRDIDDAILRAAALRPGTQVNIIMEFPFDGGYTRNLLRFLTDLVDVETLYNREMGDDELVGLSRNVDQAFFVVPDDTRTVNMIAARYGLPDVQFSPYPDVALDEQYALFVVPADGPPAVDFIPDPTARLHLELQYMLFAVSVGAVSLVGWMQRGRLRDSALVFSRLRERFALRSVRQAALAGALILFGVAAYGFRPGNESGAGWAAALAILGGAMVGLAATSPPSPLSKLERGEQAQPNENEIMSIRFLPLLIGMFLLALLMLVNVLDVSDSDRTLLGLLQKIPAGQQVGLLFGGALLMGWGLSGYAKGRLVMRRDFFPSKNEFIALGLILVLAFALRGVNLEYAIHRFIDEMHSAAAVGRLMEIPNRPILTPYGEVTAFTWVYPQMQVWAVDFYGANLTAMRVISVIFGTLTVAAVWWLGRILFDRRVALLAALLLATFPPHLHFSRLGINNAADPFFGVMALAFLARGLREGRQGDFAWAGVMLGLTQYFYEGGRLLYPALLVGFLIFDRLTPFPNPFLGNGARGQEIAYLSPSLSSGRGSKGGVKRAIIPYAKVFTFILAFTLVALPVYYTLWARDLPLAPRMDVMAEGGGYWSDLLMNGPFNAIVGFAEALVRPMWAFVQLPDESWFYSGDTALILTPLLPIFFFGFFYSVWQIRQNRGLLLLVLWLLATVMGNSLLFQKAFTPRYVVVHPALALIMAVGFVALWEIVKELWVLPTGATHRSFLTPIKRLKFVFGTLTAISVIVQVGYYFGVHVPEYVARYPENNALDDVFFRAGTLPPRTQVHIIGAAVVPDVNISGYIRYRGRQNDLTINALRPDQVNDPYLSQLPTNYPQAFFILPGDEETVNRIRQYFVLQEPRLSPYGLTTVGEYWLYYAAAQR